MKPPFFSVIVPVYNCENYLNECIESVMNQTFSDWELILVDDGSSDTSGTICDKYGRLDSRIIVIHKPNGGEFSARKAGIDIARGEYVTGLDGDDYYLNSHLSQLYFLIKQNRPDCVLFSICYVGEKNGACNIVPKDGRILSGEEFLLYCINSGDSSFCDKALKTELYNRVDYSDAPLVRFSEDEVMVYPALCNVRKASFLDLNSYCYRTHTCSVSRKHEFKHIEYLDLVMAYNLKKINEAGMLSKRMENGIFHRYLHMINVRVWDLMLSKQWDDVCEKKIDSLNLIYVARNKFRVLDYGIKESLRIFLVLNRKYKALKFIAWIYRMLGVDSVI